MEITFIIKMNSITGYRKIRIIALKMEF